MLENIIGVEEAAKILGLSPGTVKNYCAEGKIKAKKIGKTWVIDKTKLEEENEMEDIFAKDLENKRVFNENKEKYGVVYYTEPDKRGNLEVALTQQAYIDGVDTPIFKASGIDKEGNNYEIEWEVIEGREELEDMQEMCDWDNPVSVERI